MFKIADGHSGKSKTVRGFGRSSDRDVSDWEDRRQDAILRRLEARRARERKVRTVRPAK